MHQRVTAESCLAGRLAWCILSICITPPPGMLSSHPPVQHSACPRHSRSLLLVSAGQRPWPARHHSLHFLNGTRHTAEALRTCRSGKGQGEQGQAYKNITTPSTRGLRFGTPLACQPARRGSGFSCAWPHASPRQPAEQRPTAPRTVGGHHHVILDAHSAKALHSKGRMAQCSTSWRCLLRCRLTAERCRQ